MMLTDDLKKQTVDQLNSFLRGELSAAETYRQVIAKLQTSNARPVLEDCARSHQDRASLLVREVRRLGGEPADGSGVWGSFVKLLEGGAQLLGEKAAIAVLEEGEDHGKNDYQRDLPELEPKAKSVIVTQILPEQLRTHNVMSTLKRTLS